MSSVAPTVPVVVRRLAAARLPADVAALARIEGRRLLTHPIFLVAAALTLLFFRDEGDGATLQQFLDGFGFLPLASATLIVAGLAALRSTRDRTDELYASLPRRRTSRAAGQLLALLWTLPVSVALMGAAVLDNRSASGVTGVPDVPGVVQLAQGPLMVLAFGALGILLARLAPSIVAGPLAVVALIATQLPGFPAGGSAGWLLPTTTNLVRGVPSTGCDPAPGSGADCLALAYPVDLLAWHEAYVVWFVLVVAAGALIAPRKLAIAGLAALALAGAVATRLAAG